MIRKYLQMFVLVLVGILLILYPLFAANYPLKSIQLIGVIVSFSTFVFWHFDNRLSDVISRVKEELQDHLTECNLNEAMARAGKKSKHWPSVRIIATSSGQIQPLFYGEAFTADSVTIILRGYRSEDLSSTDAVSFDQTIENTIRLWRDQVAVSRRIKHLTIYRFPFFPIEYNVIFSDQVVISGLLVPQIDHFSDVRVINPTMTINTTKSGAREIGKYIERFDGFVQLCKAGGFEVFSTDEI